MAKKVLIATLSDYLSSNNTDGYDLIELIYPEGQGTIPVTSMDKFLNKPINLHTLHKGTSVDSAISYLAGLYTGKNTDVYMYGTACAAVHAMITSSFECKAELLTKAKKKRAVAEKPKAETKQVTPEDVMPKPVQTRKPRAKKADVEAKEDPAPEKEEVKKPKTMPKTESEDAPVQKKSAKNKVSADEIRSFFKKYDTADFKVSDQGMSIYIGIKNHLTNKTDLRESLKSILILDETVDKVLAIIKGEPAIMKYVKSTL